MIYESPKLEKQCCAMSLVYDSTFGAIKAGARVGGSLRGSSDLTLSMVSEKSHGDGRVNSMFSKNTLDEILRKCGTFELERNFPDKLL